MTIYTSQKLKSSCRVDEKYAIFQLIVVISSLKKSQNRVGIRIFKASVKKLVLGLKVVYCDRF
jgi:hypothetical protein